MVGSRCIPTHHPLPPPPNLFGFEELVPSYYPFSYPPSPPFTHTHTHTPYTCQSIPIPDTWQPVSRGLFIYSLHHTNALLTPPLKKKKKNSGPMTNLPRITISKGDPCYTWSLRYGEDDARPRSASVREREIGSGVGLGKGECFGECFGDKEHKWEWGV